MARNPALPRHTDDDIKRAAQRFDQLSAELDPTLADVDRTDDLAQVAAASEASGGDAAVVREAIAAARARGRSWRQIAVALGVSERAARERFAGAADA